MNLLAKFFDIDRFTKIVPILCYIFILLNLITIAKVPSTKGYEISIYEMYPYYFWFFSFMSIFLGQLMLILSARTDLRSKWIYGFLIIIITNLILLFLPIIRGYEIYGAGDVLSHMGFIRDILITGYIGTNLYPMEHILSAILVMITSIELFSTSLFIPQVFFILYNMFFFVLFDTLFRNRSITITGMLFSSILIWGNGAISLMPNWQALCCIPLFFYLVFNSIKRKQKVEYGLLCVIYIIFLIFFHPLIAFLIILSLMVLDISCAMYSRSTKRNLIWKNSNALIMIGIVVFFAWQSYALIFISHVKLLLGWFVEEAVNSEFEMRMSQLQTLEIPLKFVLELIIRQYGAFLILIFLSIISLCYLIQGILSKTKNLHYYEFFSSMGFILFLILSIIIFFLGIGFDFMRVLAWSVTLSFILLAAINYDHIMDMKPNILQKPKVPIILLLISLILISYLSIFSLYTSPFMRLPGQQVTQSDLDGTNFFFTKGKSGIDVLEMGFVGNRFLDALYGREFSKEHREGHRVLKLNDHFGYNGNSSIDLSYNGEIYLLINELGKSMYPKLYPEFRDKWRFSPYDFIQLEDDKKVQLIYFNKNFNIYYILN